MNDQPDPTLRFYAENVRGRDRAYQIEAAALQEEISRHVADRPVDVTVRLGDDPT